jgi:hypothetical protein
MRRITPMFFLIALCSAPVFCQSNTTAGLAGVGAGAALGAMSGQGATTPSSATGGGAGSSPIEIQIMVFKGMQDIARNIADRSVAHIHDNYNCNAQTNRSFLDGRKPLSAAGGKVDKDNWALEQDRKALKEDREAGNPGDILQNDRAKVEQDEKQLADDTDAFNSAQKALDDAIAANPGNCAILIEDSTSANQIALYQSVQGYSGHLQTLHDQVQKFFSLQIIVPSSISIPNGAPGSSVTVTVKNVVSEPPPVKATNNPRQIKQLQLTFMGPGAGPFTLIPTASCAVGQPVLTFNQSCDVVVDFPTSKTPPGNYSATLSILSGDPGSSESNTTQTVQLTATVSQLSEEDLKKQKEAQDEELKKKKLAEEKLRDKLDKLHVSPAVRDLFNDTISSQAAQPSVQTESAPTGGATTTPPAGGGGSTTPVDMTYLSTIMTALGGIKSAVTYAPSSFQPTTQAFQLLVQTELRIRGIFPYTSTSPLNLTSATDELSQQFGDMLVLGNDVTAWTNLCKPPAGNSTPTGGTQTVPPPSGTIPPAQNTSLTNSACSDPGVVVKLAVAQQMITGYTTLLSTSSDGSGNPVIVDVLRGKILSDKMADGIPSLQVSVAAAGGSSKTNSYFGVNLFYTFAPSYNAGVITTFELRGKDNVLLDSGAQNVLFAYGKWGSRHFHSHKMKQSGTCDGFCSVETP